MDTQQLTALVQEANAAWEREGNLGLLPFEQHIAASLDDIRRKHDDPGEQVFAEVLCCCLEIGAKPVCQEPVQFTVFDFFAAQRFPQVWQIERGVGRYLPATHGDGRAVAEWKDPLAAG